MLLKSCRMPPGKLTYDRGPLRLVILGLDRARRGECR
jgi:hypothetical protein